MEANKLSKASVELEPIVFVLEEYENSIKLSTRTYCLEQSLVSMFWMTLKSLNFETLFLVEESIKHPTTYD